MEIVSLGLDTTDSTKSNLDVYKEYFEAPFIQATEVYYTTESERFITENSVPDYMKKAEVRLNEEQNRIEMYLHESTQKPVSSLFSYTYACMHNSLSFYDIAHLQM